MNAKAWAAMGLAGLFLALLIAVLAPASVFVPVTPAPPGAPSIGWALWNVRAFEVFVQGVVLLAGVFAILVLLRPPRASEVTR